MHTPTPLPRTPSTPSRPLHSSPLVPFVMFSSPTAAAQARRRSLYKPTTPRPRVSHRLPDSPAKLLFRTKGHAEAPQKTLLRERLQARCRASAQRRREEAVVSRRSSELSDEVMDYEDDESDDVLMQDELFRRIMQSANHKKRHAYRLSYSLEVGSSFDPDLEDMTTWDLELQGQTAGSGTEEPPDELEDEELLAYAEQCAILADFADLDVATDDFSSWSDVEDAPPDSSQQILSEKDTIPDHDMDTS